MDYINEDILLNMIKCADHPRSYFYLCAIYKKIFKQPIPNIYKNFDIMSFNKIYCHSINSDKISDSRKEIGLNILSHHSSTVQYDSKITEYSIIDYNINKMNNFVNNNKQITKLSVNNYSDIGISYHKFMEKELFDTLFPNVIILAVDIDIFQSIDYTLNSNIKTIYVDINYFNNNIMYPHRILDVISKQRYDIKIIFSYEVNTYFDARNYNNYYNNIKNHITYDIHFRLNAGNYNQRTSYVNIICPILKNISNCVTCFTLDFTHDCYSIFTDKFYSRYCYIPRNIELQRFKCAKSIVIVTEHSIENIYISDCAMLEHIYISFSMIIEKRISQYNYPKLNLYLSNLPLFVQLETDKPEYLNIICQNVNIINYLHH